MTVSVDRATVHPAPDSQAYRTFFTVRSDGELVTRVEEQLESWLRQQKGWDPPTEQTGFHVGPDGRELLVLHRSSNDGRDFRARLREPSPLGTWTTSLTVHDTRDDGSWIGLHVTNGEGRFVKVPRLASFLMEAIEVRDGEVWMSSSARLIREHAVEDFAEELSCPDRQGLFFVAGTADGGPDLGKYVEQVTNWTRQTVGLAHVAVLDPAATEAFNTIMGPHHRTPPGTLRTYRPDVDPAIDDDGRRHRILGAGRLGAEPDSAVQAMLGRVARRHATEQPRPRRFTRVDQVLARLEDRVLLDALTGPSGPDPVPGPRPAPEEVVPRGMTGIGEVAAEYLAQIELVKSTLGIADVSPDRLDDIARSLSRVRTSTEALDRLTREMDRRQQRIDELEEEVEFYRDLDVEHEFALADLETDLSNSADENRWLRGRLRDLRDFDTAASRLPDRHTTDYPGDFAALAERMCGDGLPGVVFTGDVKLVRGLDEYDSWGRLARTAWDALLALSDYVRARAEERCGGGVKQYLTHTPDGFRTVPPKKYAEKETAVTMRSWGDQRAFPVPSTVDASGTAVMEAHFKLGRVGMISPRLYYFDDWSRSGTVYVGYIGSHLTNTQTS